MDDAVLLEVDGDIVYRDNGDKQLHDLREAVKYAEGRNSGNRTFLSVVGKTPAFQSIIKTEYQRRHDLDEAPYSFKAIGTAKDLLKNEGETDDQHMRRVSSMLSSDAKVKKVVSRYRAAMREELNDLFLPRISEAFSIESSDISVETELS